MTPEDFVPLILLTAGACLMPRGLLRRRWAQIALCLGTGLLVVTYLTWRLGVTVLPADRGSAEGAFVLFVFCVELLAWIDAFILFAFLVNRTDRSPEAEVHEARLRRLPDAMLPSVDVFIATYNEPIEVLEKTISGAAALDWPVGKVTVWVLDDGRRPWLERYAWQQGVEYLARHDNAGAKAGNINAAIRATSAPFFLVLDADFVPQTNFLYRTMGFFEDPRIGIVQVPHNFFNPDPMQSSLAMSKVMPDDQRFFFDAIMPGRDGYDCAFCCGSNGIVRRSALDEIGGRLPDGSVTEDMLLTLALKRRGYITRYLNERLAYGLAPESIHAFFIQRARWAKGAIQILFLPDGPLRSPGLRWHERLFFLPLHWISQTVAQSLSMVIPAIFLLTGIPPLVGASLGDIVAIQVPAIVATVMTVRMLAPHEYHPVAATVHAVLQALRLLPVVLHTLVRPGGHAFRVTPKGRSGVVRQDRVTVVVCFAICAATTAGLLLNAHYPTEIVTTRDLVPVVLAWSIFNGVVLMAVAKVAISPPERRSEQRFPMNEAVRFHFGRDALDLGFLLDASLHGGLVRVDGLPGTVRPGNWVAVELATVGIIPARVTRIETFGQTAYIGAQFAMPNVSGDGSRPSGARDGLRYRVDVPAQLVTGTSRTAVRVRNISTTGALVEVAGWDVAPLKVGRALVLQLAGGRVAPSEVAWSELDQQANILRVGLRFSMIDGDLRPRLIRKLFTAPPVSSATNEAGWTITKRIIKGILARDPAVEALSSEDPIDVADMLLPDWLIDLLILDDGEEELDLSCFVDSPQEARQKSA